MQLESLARRTGAAAIAGLVASLWLSFEGQSGGLARADPAGPPPPVSGPHCVVKGTYPMPKGAVIFDAPGAGRPIAPFTGGFQSAALSDFPADPGAGRARVATSLGAGLRIEGWVAAGVIPVFTARDVAIHAGHVWIADAQRVRLVGAASGALTAEITLAGASGQSARATGPCDSFALQPGKPTTLDTPGNGRGFLTKGTSIELFDEPGGSPIFTLRMAEGTSHLFWSAETRGGFVRVKRRGDLAIDAWARPQALEALKKGEMMDQFIPPVSAVSGAQLALDHPPRLIQATREIAVRARRDEKERPIGAVEVGAEVYLMETVAGWGNVLPKNLGLMPGDDGGFWILPADVPK